MNIPIPPLFLFENDYNQYEIMDGRQRLEAIKGFLENTYSLRGLEYWHELNGSLFTDLPPTIQRGLLRRTVAAIVLLAETSQPDDSQVDVIANPRKFGHAENGVVAFVSTLADNLNGKPLTGVNSKCLSITSDNMWPDTLSDMFARVGANKVWERLGQQASIQGFFHEAQPEKATSEAKQFLSDFMRLRNQIAHPSGAIMWPNAESLLKHVDYCEVVGHALADICSVWASTLGTRPESSSCSATPSTANQS